MPKGRPIGAISTSRSIEAEDLREVLKDIYKKLAKAGVSDASLPSHQAIVSRLVGWVDQGKVDKWVAEYASVMGDK